MNKISVLRAEEFEQIHNLNSASIHWNLTPEKLIQRSVTHEHAVGCASGAIAVNTGKFTGRSPQDRFLVRDALTSKRIHWGEINLPMTPHYFDRLYKQMIDYIQNKQLFGRQVQVCSDPVYRIDVSVITELAWSNLFVSNMFIELSPESSENYSNDWSVFCIPSFKADPKTHGTRAENFSVINFSRRIILIGGTAYTGEIKKGIFSALNFTLPSFKNTLTMHCSANVGVQGDTALFFGLSGTGKTTLSSCADRKLIGDDEHGWSPENQVFNFEDGCYAKTINLDPEMEPEIFQAIRKGALLENVAFYPDSDRVDYSNDSITENTRVSYPLKHLNNLQASAIGAAPQHIFFLSCDAFGVLPPLSKLTSAQAVHQFLLGYTAKVAGTESGVKEPQAVFSACFGAPFMPLHPSVYGNLLQKKIEENNTQVWLVNTGWIGGGYGVGNRISLQYTRALIDAALGNKIDPIAFESSPFFEFKIPTQCPGIPTVLLNPRNLWEDREAYDAQAHQLAERFRKHLEQLLNPM
ncbi:MAG: phosphoenolpyruvate carboxykinase (ATP) [Flavobacteriaceae bacterium]